MTSIGVCAAIFDDAGRTLCVKRNYGPRNWTSPGGALEPGESIHDALVREVREETGYLVEPGPLVGVYAAPFRDDLLLFFRAEIIGRDAWQPDAEIAEVALFARDDLPEMKGRTRRRIGDAFDGAQGIDSVFSHDEAG